MELHVDDDGYVRAPRGLVYRRLTDLARWPDFWPGCRVQPLEAPDHHQVVLRTSRWSRPLRLRVRAHAWRHDEGFRLDVEGDLRGSAEFWLEEGWGGTVVHHLASLEVGTRRPRASAVAYRASLRRGLWGLKDEVQSAVLDQLGLPQ